MAKSFFAMLALLLVLDMLWVTINTKWSRGLYFERMKGPWSTKPAVFMALWVLIAVAETALLWYVLHKPDMQSLPQALPQAAAFGALAGFVIYFVFNATSLVTTQSWSFKTAFVDTCWGTVLLASVAVLGMHLMLQNPTVVQNPTINTSSTFDPAITNPAAL